MKNIRVNLILLVGILSILIPTEIFAQEAPALTVYPKKILEDHNSNPNYSFGWDPGQDSEGYGTTQFWIKEPNINEKDSIVILEVLSAQPDTTDQAPSCEVDQIENGEGFHILCSNPPKDGSSLHYLLIKH